MISWRIKLDILRGCCSSGTFWVKLLKIIPKFLKTSPVFLVA